MNRTILFRAMTVLHLKASDGIFESNLGKVVIQFDSKIAKRDILVAEQGDVLWFDPEGNLLQRLYTSGGRYQTGMAFDSSDRSLRHRV